MKIIGVRSWKKSLAAGFGILSVLVLATSALAESNKDVAVAVAKIDRARILKLANEALTQKPPAVTDHVATNSAGGPHDFFSQADYFWPNPKTANHLPYVSRDGETNRSEEHTSELQSRLH